MGIFRNPEYRGVLILVLVILGVGLVMSIATGKFQQATGISLFSGPMALDKIAFVSDRSGSPEICLMGVRGSGREQLTVGAQVRSAPAMSPSGKRVVYVGRLGNADQVFSVGAGGGASDQLTSMTGPKRQPEFTPDGKQLLFIASGKVYLADTNGDNPHVILPTEFEVRAAMSDPLRRNEVPAYSAYAWGPADAGIVGVTKDAEGNDLVVYLANRGAEPKMVPLRMLVNELLEQEDTLKRRIAPDDRIRVTGVGWASEAPVFAVSVISSNDSFMVIFMAEKGEIKIAWFKSFSGQQIDEPAFSPDGLALAVATHSGDGKSVDGLLKLDLKSGQAHMIASGDFRGAAFSPQGQGILVTRQSGHESRDILLIDLQTGKLTQLTRDACSHDAIWTPTNGEHHL